MEHIEEYNSKRKFHKWYNKNYKKLLLIPLILFILAIGILTSSYYSTGEFLEKDITLTGGTSITVLTQDTNINLEEFSEYLNGKIDEFTLRELSDFGSGKQKAVIIETISELAKAKPIIEEFLGYPLDSENSSIESTGSSLGESFYKQLQIAILISFIFMALIVFFIFRNFVPSFAVVISAFADIVMTLGFMNLIGMKLSSAGITAILMIIGYSVDSDIMLTNRLLKQHGSINKNLWGAFKTGITMNITSLIALTVALVIIQSFSVVLQQIFTILLIGLGFDVLNTWITNVSILKWHLESKGHE